MVAEDYEVVKCDFCGKEDYLPFRCRNCGGYFCIEHRLPENHNCTSTLLVSEKGNKLGRTPAKMETKHEERTFDRDIVPKRIIYDKPAARLARIVPSKKEVAHISIATFIVLVVVFSSLIYSVVWVLSSGLGNFVFGTLIWMVLSGLTWLVSFVPWLSNFLLVFQIDNALWLGAIVVVSFLLHEFAHKFVAEMYGLRAEFRLIFSGVLVTLVSIISPLKFLAPGAVMISGSSDWHTVGKTSLSGPLVNLVLGIILLGLSFVFQNSTVQSLFSQVNLYQILIVGASINADIGIFNMLPFGPLDGLKVMRWKFPVWLVVFSALLVIRIFLFSLFYW